MILTSELDLEKIDCIRIDIEIIEEENDQQKQGLQDAFKEDKTALVENEELTLSPEDARALKLGEDSAAAFSADLHHLISKRFQPMSDALVQTLREGFQEACD